MIKKNSINAHNLPWYFCSLTDISVAMHAFSHQFIWMHQIKIRSTCLWVAYYQSIHVGHISKIFWLLPKPLQESDRFTPAFAIFGLPLDGNGIKQFNVLRPNVKLYKCAKNIESIWSLTIIIALTLGILVCAVWNCAVTEYLSMIIYDTSK